MRRRRKKKQRHLPKHKPKKSRFDSFRQFLSINRDILVLLGIIIAALTLFFQIYFSSAKTKPETPKPRFKIEQPAPSIPVRLVDDGCLSWRPA